MIRRFPAALLVGPLAALGVVASAQAHSPHGDLLGDLAPGLRATVIARSGDPLGDGHRLPASCDLTAYFPTSAREGYLLVGHELKWGHEGLGGRFTRFAMRDGKPQSGQLWASGMHLNCAGGVTPWGTILSGEEFPHKALGDEAAEAERYRQGRVSPAEPIADFGWIYEIRPLGTTPAGSAVRRTALGRFSHESAAVVGDREVYLTEDFEGGFFYRFVADKPRDLSSGELFAYDRNNRRWVPIRDVYNARTEARLAGATPFNRLEDVRQGPDGALYVAETGDPTAGDPHGRVWRYEPASQTMAVYLEGDGHRLSSPDNLEFDRHGHLIICEDQYAPALKAFGPNEVLRVARGDKAVTRLMTVVPPAEPTGPSFSPDGRRMYLSVMNGKKSAVVAIDGF